MAEKILSLLSHLEEIGLTSLSEKNINQLILLEK
jgi:hypothetical protein